jgi:hypothetical protein
MEQDVDEEPEQIHGLIIVASGRAPDRIRGSDCLSDDQRAAGRAITAVESVGVRRARVLAQGLLSRGEATHMSERILSCLVVGGGTTATRAIMSLLETGARVTVVSPWLAPALLEVAREGRLRWCPREYAPGDVSSFERVVAATDDAEINARVLAEALERGLPVIPAAAPPLAPDPR